MHPHARISLPFLTHTSAQHHNAANIMAGKPDPESQRLAHLRDLAQQHLTEIELDKAQEQAQLSQAEAEIQRYSKMPSYDRKKHVSSTTSKPQAQLPESSAQAAPNSALELNKSRLRPFQEILHRLRWDAKFEIGDYVVGYLERFEGIKEMPASSWIRDFSDEEWIPMHRVRYVKRVKTSGKNEDEGPELGVVWDRDGRIDKFAGSNEAANDDAQSRTDMFSDDGTSVAGGM